MSDWKADEILARELGEEPGILTHHPSEIQEIITLDGWCGQKVRVYLDGEIQLASIDEYRYHEAITRPILTRAKQLKRVLVCGGGDGCAVRELAPHVEEVVVAEHDPAMIELARGPLAELNAGAFDRDNVSVIQADAFEAVAQGGWDGIILDFPDPADEVLASLTTLDRWEQVVAGLGEGGVITAQISSPHLAPEVYWSLFKTATKAARGRHLSTTPYHTWVPSFGDWGFVRIGGDEHQRHIDSRYFTVQTETMSEWFPPDYECPEVEVHTDPARMAAAFAASKPWALR